MNNTSASEEQLLELLRQCTVKLTFSDGHGSGFFVAPGMILTCAHALAKAQKDGGAITAHWKGQSYSTTILQYLSEIHPDLKLEYPDLALLEAEVLSTINHPCVYLNSKVQLEDTIYSYGYTDEYSMGDPSTYVNEGWTGEQHLLLKLKAGQARPGLSGAPALNLRTGGVCGIIKRSRDIETDLGGRAVPTQTILQALNEKQVDLQSLQQSFHKQDRRWYDTLTQQQREELGMVPPFQSIEVFFLYAERDQELVNDLEGHMAVMQRQQLITTWNTGRMGRGGGDEKAEMDAHIDNAKIILLMISASFMTSFYRDGTEVDQVMERRKTGTIVIPVLLRPVDRKGTPFEALRPLPSNQKPVTKWPDMDSALANIAEGIRRVVEGLPGGAK
ncbi:MAG: trypsin-like peptidase domain-containing protein [Ktedonobacteraceae bacterium]|nr:trypsin-like peptidase domain-containing protein [Ktedonobacteraceae bacterium]